MSLELGGNAPFIVCQDASIDLAINALMTAKFRNAGQACIAANRILVQRSIYDEFAMKLSERISKTLVCGDGFDPRSTLGPLINAQGLNKIISQVKESVKLGATVLTGGKPNDLCNATGGTFYEPTVLVDMERNMTPFREESFGPIVPLMSYADDEEAVSLANDTT